MYADNSNKYEPLSLFINAGGIFHIADFTALPNCPNCSPRFNNTWGKYLEFGLKYQILTFNNTDFLLGLSTSYLTGNFNRNENTTIIRNAIEENAVFSHKLSSQMLLINFYPSMQRKLSNHFSANLALGISIPVYSDYVQSETIIQPEDYYFYDPESQIISKKRNIYQGKMFDNLPFLLRPELSFNYIMLTDSRLQFQPNVKVAYSINSLYNYSKVKYWNLLTISAGIDIRLNKYEKIIIPEENEHIYNIDTVYFESAISSNAGYIKGIENYSKQSIDYGSYIFNQHIHSRIDTIINHNPFIDLDISLELYNKDANKQDSLYFETEEIIYSQLSPLLNYIFFDENSSDIPKRYKLINNLKAADYNYFELLNKNSLAIYYDLLNIIGFRLKQSTEGDIIVTGYIDNIGEKNTDLAESRAMSVKNYLVSVWSVPDDRIKMKFGTLPALPSTPITEFEKMEENRRVEITSSNPQILEPVFISDTLYKILNTKAIINLNHLPESDFHYEYKLQSADSTLLISSNETLRHNALSIDLSNITTRLSEELTLELLLRYTADGRDTLIKYILPVKIYDRQKLLNEKKIDEYSLILFDFDSYNITRQQAKIVDFISNRLADNSIVEITGYTDKTGDEAYNIRLSENRAKILSNSLKHNNTIIKGSGNKPLLFDNSLPEGRFYCRTVIIRVITE